LLGATIAVKLNHFQALVVFALVISIAFGFLGRRRPKDRVKYILWTLLLFVLIGVGIGWAMYPFSH
jgi:cytochrome bd-type quinol oxidase subunit 2